MGLSYPIQATVSDPGARRSSRRLECRVSRGPLPEGCIVDMGRGLYVSSPEHCFFQSAESLPPACLFELGLELCGRYALPVQGVDYGSPEEAERRLYNRAPLTSKARLGAFLARMGGLLNQERLTRRLHYVADNSWSPMETKLYLLLVLPYRLGGYGFEPPDLNAKVVPGKAARQSSSKGFFYCDLYWHGYSLAVEYNSNLKHLKPWEHADDAKKRNSLLAMGVEVITVTSEQIDSAAEIERVARQLASGMGRRLRNNESGGFSKARLELRAALGV